MEYRIDVIDAWGRRTASFAEVPRLDIHRRGPDQPHEIRGLLPLSIREIGPGCRLRAWIGGRLYCETEVTEVTPAWGDNQKLILDRYVRFHEIVEVRSRSPWHAGNGHLARAWTNRTVGEIVRSAVNTALGPVHYWVDHAAYPEGAQREHAKLAARSSPENELETGGIESGDWVGADRIDLSQAWAKDGDTIGGLVVDGEPWPDLRLMMIDAEETTRNSHAAKRHPEVAFWTDAEYDASGYKRKADAATDALQEYLDTHGIDFIELNPHKDATGAHDDRVDAYGRYLGLVYGGGLCYNAALVERDLADILLFDQGRFHVPELALKDFYSYTGVHTDSVAEAETVFAELDFRGGVLELVAALAYGAGGHVFTLDPELGLHFRPAERADRVIAYDPRHHALHLGPQRTGLVNVLVIQGNPVTTAFQQTWTRGPSIAEYGPAVRVFPYFALSQPGDGETLALGLLDDLAYPERQGRFEVYGGDPDLAPGQLLAFRGTPLRRLDREIDGAFGDRFTGLDVARVQEVRHRCTGRHVHTRATLTSPLRSVQSPLAYLIRSQESARDLFAFRLDDQAAGLDRGFHLD